MEWDGIKNGELLSLIERKRFDVFLTRDKNMNKQQRLVGCPFAVLIMSAVNWPVVRPRIQKIAIVLDNAESGKVETIECGMFLSRVNRHEH